MTLEASYFFPVTGFMQDWDMSAVGVSGPGGVVTVSSPAQCQGFCQGHAECTHWTLIQSTNTCYLKVTDTPSGAVPGYVAGPKNC